MNKYWLEFTTNENRIRYTFQEYSRSKNGWVKFKIIHKMTSYLDDSGNFVFTSYYPTEEQIASASSYYGSTWIGRNIRGHMCIKWDCDRIPIKEGSCEPHNGETKYCVCPSCQREMRGMICSHIEAVPEMCGCMKPL
jgi:hypothetical protein